MYTWNNLCSPENNDSSCSKIFVYDPELSNYDVLSASKSHNRTNYHAPRMYWKGFLSKFPLEFWCWADFSDLAMFWLVVFLGVGDVFGWWKCFWMMVMFLDVVGDIFSQENVKFENKDIWCSFWPMHVFRNTWHIRSNSKLLFQTTIQLLSVTSFSTLFSHRLRLLDLLLDQSDSNSCEVFYLCHHHSHSHYNVRWENAYTFFFYKKISPAVK